MHSTFFLALSRTRSAECENPLREARVEAEARPRERGAVMAGKQRLYRRLDKTDRVAIENGLDKRKSCRRMAAELGRSLSTVADEVSRNRSVSRGPGKGGWAGDCRGRAAATAASCAATTARSAGGSSTPPPGPRLCFATLIFRLQFLCYKMLATCSCAASSTPASFSRHAARRLPPRAGHVLI